MRYCLPICVVCVSSHFWAVPRQIWFWKNLTKSWDSVRFGPKDQIFPFFFFMAPLMATKWFTFCVLLLSCPDDSLISCRQVSVPCLVIISWSYIKIRCQWAQENPLWRKGSVGASVQPGPNRQLWLHSLFAGHGTFDLESNQNPFICWWNWMKYEI